MRSIMGHRWSNLRQRQLRRARALRASPRLEPLEQRYVLTNSLVVVPSPVVAGGILYGTAALAANDIWAVGIKRADFTLAEHFDGNSWQVVPTPDPASGSGFLGVAGVASNDVWAVGNQITGGLIEHWDGSSWTITEGPTRAAFLNAVTATSSNDVWAVGSQSRNALVKHWDGSTWSVVSSSAFRGVDGVRSVSADASNDVWAVGFADTHGGAPFNGPAVLHFDGTSWTVVNPQTPVDFTQVGGSVTALSPTDVWAVGSVIEAYDDNGEVSDSRAAIAHWDGSQWQAVPSPDPRPGGQGLSTLTGVAAISPTDIWAVGAFSDFQTATPFTEHWDGTSWSIIPSPSPGNRSALEGVTALSDGTVAAVGFQPDVDSVQGTPLILQNPESAPPGSGPAMPAAPLFASDPRLLFAGPSTVSNVAMRDTPLMQDQMNPRSIDPVFASGKPDAALSFARDRSLAPQGPEEHPGRMDAIDRLFTEWI
jgi:hypothetical protein